MLNLQRTEDFRVCNINRLKLGKAYRQANITEINMPIDDSHEEKFLATLFEACVKLDYLLESEGHSVYVHCISGITRAPTVIAGYLCLFVKHPDWREVWKIGEFLRDCSPNSKVNRNIIEIMIETHRGFQFK